MRVDPFDPNVESDKPGTEQSEPGKSGVLGSKASRRSALGLLLGAPLLGACAGVQQSISQFSVPNPFSSSQPAPGPGGPQQPSTSIGNGQVKVALILPLSAGGGRGRGDHSRAAVCVLGPGGRASGPRPWHFGDRVLDRFERGLARRLS